MDRKRQQAVQGSGQTDAVHSSCKRTAGDGMMDPSAPPLCFSVSPQYFSQAERGRVNKSKKVSKVGRFLIWLLSFKKGSEKVLDVSTLAGCNLLPRG